MRGETQQGERVLRSFPRLALAIAACLIVAGCSAANLTDFDFPVFGLVKKSDQEKEDPVMTGSIGKPEGEQRLGAQ